MRRGRLRKLLLYLALGATASVLLFPFYWVVTSSFKTLEGLSMQPPSFYPSEYVKENVRLSTAGRMFEAADQRWFLLVRSRDLIQGSTSSGGYYARMLGDEPSQLIEWFGDGAVVPSEGPDEVVFSQSRVVELDSDRRDVVLVARTVRESPEGTPVELLFIADPDAARADRLQILQDVEYTARRGWKVRLANYPETLRGPEASFGEKSTGFFVFMRNSFFISFMAVLGQILSSSLVAFAFSRLKFKGREILFILVLATMMIPAQVTLIPLFSIYKYLGWIDTFLPLIVPHFTAGAFNIFLLRQYMLTLPKELDESAAIDGCGPLRTFFYVILPNCKPVLIVVGLFTFVATWQDMMGPLIYLDNPEYRTVTLGLEYFRSPYVDNRHLLMTGAVLAMMPVAILFLFFQRYIVAGISTTGLKG